MLKQFGLLCVVFCFALPVFAQQNTHMVTVPVAQLRDNSMTADQFRRILERDQARVKWIGERIRQADEQAAAAEGKLSRAKFEQFRKSLLPKSKPLDEIREQMGLSKLNYPF